MCIMFQNQTLWTNKTTFSASSYFPLFAYRIPRFKCATEKKKYINKLELSPINHYFTQVSWNFQISFSIILHLINAALLKDIDIIIMQEFNIQNHCKCLSLFKGNKLVYKFELLLAIQVGLVHNYSSLKVNRHNLLI